MHAHPPDHPDHQVAAPSPSSQLHHHPQQPLLGVPDRSASASAPPDLEISSRSLFAFKADYSGIFSDIRMDEDYESFYNENPERMNLPPPLQSSTAATTTQHSPRPNPSTATTSTNNPQTQLRADISPSKPPPQPSGLPPRVPTPSAATPFVNISAQRRAAAAAAAAAVAAASVHQPNNPTTASLHREDSNNSFDDLIYRDSRAMMPLQTPFPDQTGSPHADTRAVTSSSSPLQHTKRRQAPHLSPQQHQRQHSPPPQPHPRQSMHHDQPPLWKLAQLSLDPTPHHYDTPSSTSPFASHPPSSTAPAPAYPYHHSHPQHLPTPAAVAAAAVAAAAHHASSSTPSYVSQSHRSSHQNQQQQSHQQQHNRQQHEWPPSHHHPNDASRKPIPTAAAYDARDNMLSLTSSFVNVNGNAPPVADIFPGLHGPTVLDDPLLAYDAQSPGISPIPYGNIAAYRESTERSYSASRGMFAAQSQSPLSGGRNVSSRGRNGSPRLDSNPPGYGYGAYGSGGGGGAAGGGGGGAGASNRHSSFESPRGRAVPVIPAYVTSQATAAAAAAAAAVFQSNGVHLNGTGGYTPVRTGNGPSQPRVLTSRSTGRFNDARRSSGAHHQDTYGRGPVSHVGGTSRNSGSSDRGLMDRSGGGGGSGGGNDGGSAAKFSSFNDVVGRAEELARDQHGCRFLQTKLEEGNIMYINSIFEECYEKFVDLMTDPFGNYLCQKLFEFCSDAQRLALVERCAPAIPAVSTNMHGTRAVQRMIEFLSTPEQVRAVCKALQPAAVSLMKDINGNHVIQRCLNRMDPQHNQFVYDAVASNCFELATHRHGCCVMQRCMDFASPMQRNQLAKQINANALPLVQNAFGNYVVQYVLELNDPVYTEEIIRRLRGHLAELSMQKFSSNVVEKSLQLSTRELRHELIEELISDQETMRRLLHDAYGNYVIQRALQIAEGPQLERICEAIRPHLHSLKQSPYGKRIQAKIVKRMPKGIPPLPPSV